MLSADILQYAVVKRLGIYAYSSHAVPFKRIKLFLCHGVGSARLHRIFGDLRKVKALLDLRQNHLKLSRRQLRGRSPAEIDRGKPQSDFFATSAVFLISSVKSSTYFGTSLPAFATEWETKEQ